MRLARYNKDINPIKGFSSFVAGLCEVESGQSNIILDIEESRGDGKFAFNLIYV